MNISMFRDLSGVVENVHPRSNWVGMIASNRLKNSYFIKKEENGNIT
jgi:hypothetical protein